MKPYQEAVIKEKSELDDRIARIQRFMKPPGYSDLPQQERDLIAKQIDLMAQYSYVLAERIAAFE